MQIYQMQIYQIQIYQIQIYQIIKCKYIKYKYNMRNDIGCKFLYDKILIKIYDITGEI